MSLTDLQIAAPQDMASLAMPFKNAVSANLNHEPRAPEVAATPSRSINTGVEGLNQQIQRIGADVKMAQTPAQGSVASDLFGMGCNALSAKIEPVQEIVMPTQAPALPEPDAPQMRYANELSAPRPMVA